MKRCISQTVRRSKDPTPENRSFLDRLAHVIAEYGSRYALSKASGIPPTTLQNYALGSIPKMDTLATLARIANVDLTWLATGKGQMRGTGQLPGASLADVVMVDQHDPRGSLAIPFIINQIPFSRTYLERDLRVSDPGPDSLLAIESSADLLDVSRGDLLLIDRKQANIALDGLHLLDFPGFSLRGIFKRSQGELTIVEPRSAQGSVTDRPDRFSRAEVYHQYQMNRRELLGDGHQIVSKVVGRVVWIGRAL
jgi:hypothetical protein